MPRRNPPSTITLLLPSPSPSSSSSSSTKPILPDTPDIEVLILAKKLAAKKGQKFDIESYLSSDQLESYRTKYLGLPPKPKPKPKEATPPPPSVEPSTTTTAIDGTQPPTQTETQSDTPATPILEIQSPTPTPTGTGTPGTPAKKPFKFQIPDLSHLHWKQRAKRLAELQREAEMIANGEIPEPASSVVDDSILLGGKKGELTEKDKEGIRGSASYWNSLLISARKSRGPQWDYSLQQFQYDRFSSEYYTHGKDPRGSPILNGDKRELQDGEDLNPNEGEGDGVEGGVGNDNDINESPSKKRKLDLALSPVTSKLNGNHGDLEEGEGTDEENRKRIKSNSVSNSIPKQSPLVQSQHPNPSIPQAQPQRTPSQSQFSTSGIGIPIGRPSLPSTSSSQSSITQTTNPGMNPQSINPNILASLQQFQAQQPQGFNPSQLSGLNPQQLAGAGLNPQQFSGISALNSQQPGLGGLNPQQLGLNAQQLNGLNPQQLVGLQNMMSSMNPQFLQQMTGGMSQHGLTQGLGMGMGMISGFGGGQNQQGGPMLSGSGAGNGNWSSDFTNVNTNTNS
ncbi:hypothetical protein I302_105134 [Kwoniella bestiolae CBS 10118]|uniref:Uncharacterized protein n=1 Tax=Kwoniella bestiolae CBS 10118 TaxID=1296100 RepID=A0A1B9FS99_9TREE|nr:hypothetical protein I302_08422 [Kwoniella bestiolae CBS 10118]OCF21646.1 hypothetical protein I302_08422 [Kwoniella bestiolae CBS 10118]